MTASFVKGVICAAVVVLIWQWHVVLRRWAADRLYLGPHLPFFYDALLAIGALTACLAVWSLTANNARRVTTNTLTMLATTVIGMLFGDPSCHGSYDHGGGETVQGCLTFGIFGALAGYLWTQWQEINYRARLATTDTPREPTAESPPD